jgi:transposase
VVSKYVSLATTAELTWEELRELDEAAIAARLLPGSRSSAYVPPDYARIHQELRRKGVTLTLLWQEYVDAHPGGKTYRHTQFCEHYHAWAKNLKRSMRQVHKAGEKLFVDYAGPTIARPCVRRRPGRLELHLRLRHAARDDGRLDRLHGARTEFHWRCP